MTTLEEARRDAAVALVERMLQVDALHLDGPQDQVGPSGQVAKISWGGARQRGTDFVTLETDLDRPAGEELARRHRGERLVAMTVRVDCFDHAIIALEEIEKLRTSIQMRGWRDEWRKLGFVIVTVGPSIDLTYEADDFMRSSAGVVVQLRYLADAIDPFRFTWIEVLETKLRIDVPPVVEEDIEIIVTTPT